MADLKLFAVQGSMLYALPLPPNARDVHDLFDLGVDLPAGVYSALRTYHGNRFLRLEQHMARCRRCVVGASWDTAFDFDALTVAIAAALNPRPATDTRLRFDLYERPVVFGSVETQVVLGIGPHSPVPAAVLALGAQLELAPEGLARPIPEIKFTAWVRERMVCKQFTPNAFEHLLLDEQRQILEGTSSNFYAVRDATLITAGEGVLEGITRQLTLELAERRGLKIELRRLPISELHTCSEAFITSSTRELVPVTSVASNPIGNGKPGPVVQALSADYHAYAQTHAALP